MLGVKFAFPMASGMAAKLIKIVEFATAGSKAVLDRHAAGRRRGWLPRGSDESAERHHERPGAGRRHEPRHLFGSFAELLVGLWGALELIVDPYMQARKGLIGVTGFQMADIAALHGEFYCVGTGATA